MEGKLAAPGAPTYIEFDPLCQWQREEARDVLVLHLPEFKKQQLRVQVNNRGILKISGERFIESMKKSKFYKEVEVPKYCDPNGIQAKFANDTLSVIMPKTPNAPTEQTKAPEVDGSWEVDRKGSEATQAGFEKPAPAKAKEIAGSSKEKMQPSPHVVASADGKKSPNDIIEPKMSSISRMKSCGKKSLNIAVAVAVLAALCSYVYYMYGSVILED